LRWPGVYALPFPSGSFDVAFGNQVLQHLGDPAGALGEVHRVLKPGGLLAVRDTDQGTRVIAPPGRLTAQLEEAIALYSQLWVHNGGDPYIGRRHRELLRITGFARSEASATASVSGTAETTRSLGETMARAITRPDVSERLADLGLADQARLDRLAEACRAWGELPEAFTAAVECEALGWTTGDTPATVDA
jgi:SAM-dependent methyltransferase